MCVCVLKCNLTRVLADNAGKFDLLLNVKAVCIAVLNGQHVFLSLLLFWALLMTSVSSSDVINDGWSHPYYVSYG